MLYWNHRRQTEALTLLCWLPRWNTASPSAVFCFFFPVHFPLKLIPYYQNLSERTRAFCFFCLRAKLACWGLVIRKCSQVKHLRNNALCLQREWSRLKCRRGETSAGSLAKLLLLLNCFYRRDNLAYKPLCDYFPALKVVKRSLSESSELVFHCHALWEWGKVQ